MQRIMIIGGSATGKSTLARIVGGRLSLPVIHLVNYGRERADIGPGCPERLDLDFLLRWVWTYPTRSRPGTLKLLEGIAGTKRVVVLRMPREVAAFAADLPASLIPGREQVVASCRVQ